MLLPYVKLFQKIKGGLELVTLPQILNFIVQLPLLLEILGIYVVYCNYLLPNFDDINFEINLSFLKKLFFLHDHKSQDKILIILK